MELSEYQFRTGRTAIYPHVGQQDEPAITYCVLGLCGEVGEISNVWKKFIRGGKDATVTRMTIAEELGDVLWYLCRLARELNFDIDDIAEANLAKLRERALKGEIATHE